jgi:hypothetical protein
MRPAFAVHRARELPDEATDGTTIVVHKIDREMWVRRPGMGDDRPPETHHALYITLRGGFRGHAVVITVDGREIYHRAGVSTDPTISRADVVEVVVTSRLIQLVVSATPGDYVASLDLDVSAHPHLAISLVGEGTVGIETSLRGFT